MQGDLPHNEPAEQEVLGALMARNSDFEKVSDILLPEHFHIPAHQRIFLAIASMVDSGRQANAVTLKNAFEQDGDLEHIGGARYLADLMAASISVINLRNYAEILIDLHGRRQIIERCREGIARAMDTGIELGAAGIASDVEASLEAVAAPPSARSSGMTIGEAMGEHIDVMDKVHRGEIVYTPTGLAALDHRLGGMKHGELYVVGARPAMGKSAFAGNVARHVALTHGPVYFWSGEMAAEQIASRFLSKATGISCDQQTGSPDADMISRAVEARAEIADVPLFIDDRPALTWQKIESGARRWRRRIGGLSLVVVDYIQLMQVTERVSGRVEMITVITQALKAMAKRLNAPVLALSQLSRQVEQREDKRPMLSDLRESGSIEQDGGVVMFLYREEYYLEKSEPEFGTQKHDEWLCRMNAARGKVDVITAKNRYGRVGCDRFTWDGVRQEFR